MAIQIAQSIQAFKTPPELIINADQTGVHLLPSPSQTWSPSGDKQVQIIGQNEKHQVMLMVASTAAGGLLPSQVIVPGKTCCSLPPPEKCHPFSPYIRYFYSGGDKHWSNMTMMKMVHAILLASMDKLNLIEYLSGLQISSSHTSEQPRPDWDLPTPEQSC
jgi:hypothetical protein